MREGGGRDTTSFRHPGGQTGVWPPGAIRPGAHRRPLRHVLGRGQPVAAGFSFESGTYEWLVINQGGTNAQFKGSGTINDGLDPNGDPYKFMIWARDGSPDTLRIRIWWEVGGVENVVYDNATAQAIGGGNIVVHKEK